ncbi:MAG: hypothetical protein GY895_16545 [Phycisphaera sp.]|nr:hypothetical protein [Phycisphaera sp.]
MSEEPDQADTKAMPPEATSKVISRIEGVRPCLQCGHDLHGQPIRRETSLGLLVTFCPECGTAAALAEHPTFSVWGRRLGVAVMITVIAAVIVGFLLTILCLFGMTMGISMEAIRDARTAVQELNGDSWQIEQGWWLQNADAARKVMWAAIDFQGEPILLTLMFSPLCFVIGVIWSGVLLGIRGWLLPLAGLPMLVIAWMIVFIAVAITRLETEGSFPISVYRLVEMEMLPAVGAMVLTTLGLALILGLLAGRPILRAVVRFVLPPRARPMLRPLWEIDGKSPTRIADA